MICNTRLERKFCETDLNIKGLETIQPFDYFQLG